MRRIDRGLPPLQLSRLLEVEPDKQWSSSGIPHVMEAVRDKLWTAQDGLCAYCEIRLDRARAHVEHIHPRSRRPCPTRMSQNHHFEWSNLLLVCTGNGTCDESKGDKHLCDDMAFPDTIAVGDAFEFDTLSGRISPRHDLGLADHGSIDRSIQELGLDDIDLRRRRKAVIHEAQRRIMEEGESPRLVMYEMQDEGFPTTVDFVCRQLG